MTDLISTVESLGKIVTNLKLGEITVQETNRTITIRSSSDRSHKAKLEVADSKEKSTPDKDSSVLQTEKQVKHTEPQKTNSQSQDKIVYSPFVGTFYDSPSPEAHKFISPGKNIKKGEPLCIIEAMKIMNEVDSEWNGTIKEIFVKNEEAVEYKQKLFSIEPKEI